AAAAAGLHGALARRRGRAAGRVADLGRDGRGGAHRGRRRRRAVSSGAGPHSGRPGTRAEGGAPARGRAAPPSRGRRPRGPRARVTGVVLERETLSCASAVLALGPWSADASDWIGVPIDVRPLKGQILRLQAPGPPVECSVGWGHNYATTKTDGLLWAGTTEE